MYRLDALTARAPQVSMVNGDGEYFCSGLDLAHMRVSNEKKVQTTSINIVYINICVG